MPNKMTEEEILRAIFEGPVRPLTKKDQAQEDERERVWQEKTAAKNIEYAKILGVSVERVEEMRKNNLLGLIETVALRKISDPDGSRARQLRALLSAR